MDRLLLRTIGSCSLGAVLLLRAESVPPLWRDECRKAVGVPSLLMLTSVRWRSVPDDRALPPPLLLLAPPLEALESDSMGSNSRRAEASEADESEPLLSMEDSEDEGCVGSR